MSGRRRWRDLPLWVKALAAGAVPGLILLATSAIGYRLHRELDAAEADFARAVAIQNDIQTLHILQVEAAMATRGHLLTQRLDVLAPYERARAATQAILESMQARIRDPGVLRQHATVSTLVARFQDDLAALLRPPARGAPAGSREALERSKTTLERLRSELGEMQRREAALVARFASAARRATEQNYRYSLAASVLILISSAAAVLWLLGGMIRRIARLVGNAERLVRDQPLLASDDSRDELGELAVRLDLAARLLAERATAAQIASEAKTRFLSRTSHELRTPLQAIVGHAQLLCSAEAGSESATGRRARQIGEAARHLLQLIDDILDIGSAEAGLLKVDAVAVDVGSLIEDTASLLRPVIDQGGHRLVLDAPAQPCIALADPRRLRQVLLNLVSNAIKFNRPGGEIRIACVSAANHVAIDVHDQGQGFSDDALARLFTPLERLDAEQRGIAGNGLGLAISRQLVDAMAGRLTARSTPGAGATFSLQLPAIGTDDAPAAPVAAPRAQAIAAADGAPRALLLVGVGDDSRAVIAALLARRPGWVLLAAPDLEAGQAMLARQAPNLIVFGASADLDTPLAAGATPLRALLGAAPAAPDVRGLALPLQVRPFLSLLDECECRR